MKWIAAALLAALLLVLPIFAGDFYVNLASQVLIAAIFALSLNLLVGFGGMTSLGHASYLGVAAYISALLTSRYGFGHGSAALISIAGTTAMAAFFGVIALRATGLGFLMITLALSQVLWGLAYRMSGVTNGDNGIAGLTRPMPLGISLDSAASFYWFALIVASFAFLMMTIFVSSSFGSSLKGVRDQPRRMAALGFNPWLIRWITFVYAGFWGGVSGLLYVYYNKYIHPTSLSITSSAEALLGVIAGGSGTLSGPVVGAALVLLLKNYASAYIERWNMLLGLVFLFIVLVMPDRNRSRLEQAGVGNPREIAMIPPGTDYALEVVNLQKAFGGLIATQNVSLSIRPGERRLIIGPNGAGKTTLFNQISGDMRPNSGQIKLFGSDMTRFSPYKRAHFGLSRTYQIITLFNADTLEHNVTLGLLGLRPSRWQMWRPLSFYSDLATEARRTLDTVGLYIWPTVRFPILPMAKSAGLNSRWRLRKSRACCCWTNRWLVFPIPNDPR